MNTKSNTKKIKEDLANVDNQWLKLHFQTGVGIVILSFVVEIMMWIVLEKLNQIHVSWWIYGMKYLVLPIMLEFLMATITWFIIRNRKINLTFKIYAVSILFVGICFILFSVHSIFHSLYLIFSIPILMTIVYNNYCLTAWTAILSILAKIVSEVFITWDPDKVNFMKSGLGIANFMLSIFILLSFFVMSIIVIFFEKKKDEVNIQKELERYELKERVQIDELTGIHNRTRLNNRFRIMEKEQKECKNHYIFAIIDMDNFKLVNDTFGHAVGDKCLRKFSVILKNICKEGEAYRYGGDEFCLVFKNLTLQRVEQICKLLQEEFLKVALREYQQIPLSLSIGIAEYTKGLSTHRLFRNADAALYQAKIKKNGIEIWNK